MAQRIKKQLFRIMPLSVVVMMIFAMAIGVWQGLPTNKAQAAAATVVSAKVTSPTQFTVVYTVPVDAVFGNYSNLVIDGTAETSVDSMTGTGTTTHVITFTPDIALTIASTGVVDIAALVDGGSGNTFVGQLAQALTDGQAPVITALVVAPNTGTSKVGDTVTLNIAADAAGYTASNITLNGVNITASNFQDLTGGAYSADYVIADGDADVLSGAITASVVLTDAATNSNVAFTTVTANTLVIDANLPVVTALVVAPNTGTSKVGDTVTLNIAADAAGYTATNITLNGVNITASNFQDLTGGAYSADYIISEGDADVLSGAITASVVLTDGATNSNVAYTTVTANTLDIDANSPTIANVIVSPDGVTAKIGDSITATIVEGSVQADLSLAGACTINAIDVSGSFANNLDGTYTLTYLVSEGDGDVGTSTLAISCALQEPSLNTVTASVFDFNTLAIDANSPTSTYEDVYSDNTFDPTLAGVGKYVIVEVTPSEPLLSLSVDFINPGFGVIPAVDDGSGCDALGADLIWTACAPVTSNPPDSDAVAVFTIDMTDLAGNPASILSGALLASVTVDTIAPSITQIKALTQIGGDPVGVTNNWYYYAGQNIRFSVTSDQPLSALKACTQSLANDTMGDLCSVVGPNDFETGAPGTDYINFTNDLGGNEYEFILPVATFGVPTAQGGYAMNLYLVDEAGNASFSTAIDGSDSFAGVFGVNPYNTSGLDNAGTTDWSTDIADFTNVTNLSFTMNDGVDDLGSLVLDGPIDLTDASVIDNLSALSSDITIGGGDGTGLPAIGLDPTLLSELNGGATLTVYVPTAVRPGLVVYADDGTTVLGYVPNDESGSPVVGGDTLSGFVWNAGAQTLTFDTDGFSFFGTDNTAPTATFNPLNAATGVPITTEPTITFSEPVDTATFTYTMTNSTGVTWSAGDTVATISHTAFLNSTPYTLTVTAVSDKVGNAIVGTPSATFTTAAPVTGGGGDYTSPADTTPPTSTSISINSGAVETSSQSVTLTLGATDAAQMMISNSSDFSGASWETYATSKSWILTVGTGTKTVYARFKDAAGNISISVSDTINSTATTEIPADNTGLILQDPAPAPALPPQVTIGTLVKRADMTSVYFIDQDNRRHAFPNSAVYLSYYPDFSGIQTISAEIMAEIPLGNNVTMRPGTYLVKIQADPKVYAVAPYGVLKQIGSEAIATSLYGADWATRIVDVEPTFFSNYQIGSAITTAILPTGSAFSYAGDSKVYYVDGGNKRYVSSGVFSHNNFQNRFIIRNVVTSNTYPDGADLPSHGMETIMTLR